MGHKRAERRVHHHVTRRSGLIINALVVIVGSTGDIDRNASRREGSNDHARTESEPVVSALAVSVYVLKQDVVRVARSAGGDDRPVAMPTERDGGTSTHAQENSVSGRVS